MNFFVRDARDHLRFSIHNATLKNSIASLSMMTVGLQMQLLTVSHIAVIK